MDELHRQADELAGDVHDPTACHLCPACAAQLAELYRIVKPLAELVEGIGAEVKGGSPLALVAQLVRGRS